MTSLAKMPPVNVVILYMLVRELRGKCKIS